ncbi:hypothetical protein FACS1894184_01900 [Clostridia bacterium]|nr:hypothetical protein FACS1894184_01900 [Clostridia bacterium]
MRFRRCDTINTSGKQGIIKAGPALGGWFARYDALAGVYASTIDMALRCGITTNRPTLRRDDTRERVFSITWLLSGESEYCEQTAHGTESSCLLDEGILLLRRPDRPSRFTLNAGFTHRRCFIDADPRLYQILLLAVPELSSLSSVTPLPFGALLLERFAVFVRSVEQLDSAQPVSYIGALCDMIRTLYRTSGTITEPDEPILKAARLMTSQPVGVTLTDIADKCGLPYSEFRKRFMAAFGQTPGKWRIAGRVERAKQQLAAGEPIASVADHLAYSDVYSFTHQFRSVTGMTPKQYQLRNVL